MTWPLTMKSDADNAFLARDRSWHPKGLTPSYNSSILRSPKRALLQMPASLSEVSGPVFGHTILGEHDGDMLVNAAQDGDPIGERIVVSGRVLDEYARPQAGVLIEIWQANAGGRYAHVRDGYLAPMDRNFSGYGRCVSDIEGRYSFRTIRPGPYPFPNNGPAWRPAHIHLSLFGASFAQRLITQFYFEGDPLIKHCAIVNAVSDPKAVDAMVAKLDLEKAIAFDALAYRFDIVLRGREQTRFDHGHT
ncbi:MAG: protocatechuate 3,4-dioxygenase subunit beta [Anderseniella sp.]